MPFFETALGYFGLFCVVLLVSQEVRAATTAVLMARDTKYRGAKFHALVRIRYFFTSPLFHPAFAQMRGKSPAYETVGSMVLFTLTVALATTVGGLESRAEAGQALGCAFLVSGSYFAARYGRAFLKEREFVAETNAKGNPFSFSPIKI